MRNTINDQWMIHLMNYMCTFSQQIWRCILHELCFTQYNIWCSSEDSQWNSSLIHSSSNVALYNDTFEMALIWNWITDLSFKFQQWPPLWFRFVPEQTHNCIVCSSKVYCDNFLNIIIRNINHLNGNPNPSNFYFKI